MVEIRQVSYADILDAPNAAELLEAYSKDCIAPDYNPQREMYAAMERVNALKCFGAYRGGSLVGFASVLSSVMPHTGKKSATMESLFVLPAHRNTGAGVLLLDASEKYARESGCAIFSGVARIGSAFEKVLLRRAGFHLTHSQHTRFL